jgi:hypothetical protein
VVAGKDGFVQKIGPPKIPVRHHFSNDSNEFGDNTLISDTPRTLLVIDVL